MFPDKDEQQLALLHVIDEMEDEIKELKHVVFTLAMVDLDSMTEHDHALLEEAITCAKAIYESEEK